MEIVITTTDNGFLIHYSQLRRAQDPKNTDTVDSVKHITHFEPTEDGVREFIPKAIACEVEADAFYQTRRRRRAVRFNDDLES